MNEVKITKAAACRVLRPMVVSCGSAGCFEAIRKLEAVEATLPLAAVGQDADGRWYMAVFSRLNEFAVAEGLETLDVFDVARYFGGAMHVRIMAGIADHAMMGQYLGPYVGLVTHVLLPLDEDLSYRNAGHEVDFDGHTIAFNPSESGVPCYHLGVVVNLPLTSEQVKIIKAEQAESGVFTEALAKIKGPIVPPTEYWEALTCTVKKVASD